MNPVNNLPLSLTNLVGRKQEIAEVQQLLTSSRLVTLIGAGGCGKTRLAQAVAGTVVGQFADGVGWVEFAQLDDPLLVAQAVAKALQISEQPLRSLMELLQATLATRRLLLVLDNCEHLLATCAALVETLLQTTTVQILATSRESLGVMGERRYPVPTLTLPEPNQPHAAIAETEAAQLFVERARSIHPAFTLNSENAEAVAAVCRQLDGMPLAIELAAARINILSIEQIQKRLSQSLDLLVTTTRTDQRHRTLRNTIDWSYALLLPHEQVLLQRLSVFPAGFTLTTVEAVCAWGAVEQSYILDLLTSLVNKSLVVTETIQAQEARYRMLETIRQYAGEKLAASAERIETYDRYLESFLGFAEEIAPKLYEQYQKLWIQWLEDEHDNLRTALAWALERNAIEAGLRIAIAVYRFWEVRSYVQEGFTWFEQLLAQADASISRSLHVHALSFAAFLANFLGHRETPLRYGRKAVVLAENASENSAPLLIMALSGLAAGFEAIEDLEAAYDIHEQVLELLRKPPSTPAAQPSTAWVPNDPLILGMTVMVQGGAAVELGYYERAHYYLDESLQLALAADDPFRLAHTFYLLGNLAYCEQAYTTAQLYYEQGIEHLRQLGAARDLTTYLQNLGHTCLRLDDSSRAYHLFRESLTIQQSEQNRPGMAECLLGFAALAVIQDMPIAGVLLFAAAEQIGWRRAKSSWAVSRRAVEHYFTLARSALPPTEFEVARTTGRSFSLAQAIEYAQNLPLVVGGSTSTFRTQLDDLTARERAVAALIGLGKSNGEIAEHLVLSKRTVEKHIAHIFAKLGLTQRTQIALWAVEQGLNG